MSRRAALGRDLLLTIQLATLELKFHNFIRALERHYNPDQPRVPAGNSDGGQWSGGGGSQGAVRSNLPGRKPVQTALAGVLVTQRVGVGDSELIRQCIYQDMFGRQFGFEQSADKLCPPTYPTKPYYGLY